MNSNDEFFHPFNCIYIYFIDNSGKISIILYLLKKTKTVLLFLRANDPNNIHFSCYKLLLLNEENPLEKLEMNLDE